MDSTRIEADRGDGQGFEEAGFRFAVRYLSRKAKPSSKDLTADELNIILDAGLAVMAVQHVAPAGWTPSDTLGVEYGGHAAAHAGTVGLVEKSSVWLDLEGDRSGYWGRRRHRVLQCLVQRGRERGLHDRCLRRREQYSDWRRALPELKTKHYWKSGSNVPDIPHRGYCMVQHITPDDKVGGVEIDRNVTFVDAFGSAPMLVTRDLAIDMAALASPILAEPVAPSAPAVVARNNDEAILRELAASYELSAPMEALINFRNDCGAPMSARYWAIADFNLRSSEPGSSYSTSRTTASSPTSALTAKGPKARRTMVTRASSPMKAGRTAHRSVFTVAPRPIMESMAFRCALMALRRPTPTPERARLSCTAPIMSPQT